MAVAGWRVAASAFTLDSELRNAALLLDPGTARIKWWRDAAPA
ncbi:MAG: hypothetical protein ACFBWO_00350 [Paracoccaceae bacterium]